MNKRDFPRIHFYDQDFVDIYNKSWNIVADCLIDPKNGEKSSDGYFVQQADDKIIIDQFESILSSFFLVYSNKNYDATHNINYFYERQEENGAIRWKYNIKNNEAIFTAENPEGIGLPLFPWAEFNLYHKISNKKRIKEIMQNLTKYMDWIDATFKRENGLYAAPTVASTMTNSPRFNVCYPIDFNAAMAISANYMSNLGNILNDKDIEFQYKRLYFSIKTRINSMMWDPETSFYYDLDENGNRLPVKTIAGFWPLLAEVPNADKADELVSHLTNPATFGTDHPFPTLSHDHPNFSVNGDAFYGSVYPMFNFMVIKGLERYEQFDIARESAIRHLYFVLDSLMPSEENKNGDVYEAYLPTREGPAILAGHSEFPRSHYIAGVGLSTIALMIENVVGLLISLPKKTVDWVIPNLEVMGIENLSLKRNLITILSMKNARGWEIQMESEKLYYFTINVLNQKKKTLPIPSGKCTMLIDKI